MARKELKKNTDIIDLSFEDKVEENGFDTAAGGIPLSSFSFSEDNTQVVLPEKLDEVPSCNKGNAGGLIDTSAGKPCALLTNSLIHIAISIGSVEKVNSLTETLRKDGYMVVSEPRYTGDGYYESCILDPYGNRLEITE